MTVSFATLAEERQLMAYTTARNKVRDIMTTGVFPNCQAAIGANGLLAERLANPADLGSFAAYHESSTALVAPHIATLQEHMAAICEIMIAIDRAAIADSGAPLFGIPLPVETPAGLP